MSCSKCLIFSFEDFLIFLEFLDLAKFSTVLSALPLRSQTILLLSALNTLRANLDDLVVFNIGVSSTTIPLKLWIKR